MASGPFTLARLAQLVGMDESDVQFCVESGLLQPPRRQRGRPKRVAFHDEHLERMQFIKRALGCGFTYEDIERLVDPLSLVTCGDISQITAKRLDAMRAEGKAKTREAICLAELYASCSGLGSRKDCRILEGLALPNA